MVRDENKVRSHTKINILMLQAALGAVELSSLFLQQFVGYLYKAELV